MTKTSNSVSPSNLTQGGSLFEAFGYKFTSTVVGTGDIEDYTTFTKELDSPNEQFIPQDSDFRLFHPEDDQNAFINTADQDFIFTYGIQMRYYKVLPREEQPYFNDIYGEAPSRAYEGAKLDRNNVLAFVDEVDPMVLWGLYAPDPFEQSLTLNALDTKRTANIWVNIVYIRKMLGRDPVMGDIVIPWDIPQQTYEVRQVLPDNKTLYFPRRWRLHCELIQLSK